MDTAAHYHRYASPINKARTHVAFAMRLSPNITKTNNHRIQQLPVFCLNAVTKHMAATTKSNQDPIKKEEEEEIKIKEKEEQEERKSKKILQPPPPEKPEPGDCCGSGCVRCVWDVYYDELDAYNKLYKCDDSNDNEN